jgi:hypothetical protein
MEALFLLIARILNGEPLRKPTPEEEREWASRFVLLAAYFALMALSLRYARHFINTVSASTLTVIAAIVVCALWFVPRILGRHVPAKVSWVIGAIAWSLLFFLALTGHIV